jgi:hypothetical protein
MEPDLIQRTSDSTAVEEKLVRKTTGIYRRYGNLANFLDSLARKRDENIRSTRVESESEVDLTLSR